MNINFHTKLSKKTFIGGVIIWLLIILTTIIFVFMHQINKLENVNKITNAKEQDIKTASFQGRITGISAHTSDWKSSQSSFHFTTKDSQSIRLSFPSDSPGIIPPFDVDVTGLYNSENKVLNVQNIKMDDVLIYQVGGTKAVQPGTTYRISGQVLNVGNAQVTQCPSANYPGVNNIIVKLWGPGTPTLTGVGGSGQDGAFYFDNVSNGTYNVCAENLSTRLTYLCNTPRADGRDPFGTTCARVNVNNGSISGVRLILKTASFCNINDSTDTLNEKNLTDETSPDIMREPGICVTSIDLNALKRRTIELVNALRARQGICPLIEDDRLNNSAEAHNGLVVSNSTCSHQYPGEPPIYQRIANAGYSPRNSGWLGGETIGCNGQFPNLTPGPNQYDPQTLADNVVMGTYLSPPSESWYSSTGHRAILLDSTLENIGCRWWTNNQLGENLRGTVTCNYGRHNGPTPRLCPSIVPTATHTPPPTPTTAPTSQPNPTPTTVASCRGMVDAGICSNYCSDRCRAVAPYFLSYCCTGDAQPYAGCPSSRQVWGCGNSPNSTQTCYYSINPQNGDCRQLSCDTCRE